MSVLSSTSLAQPAKGQIFNRKGTRTVLSPAHDALFSFESSRARYRAAPLLEAREVFLSHLLEQGTSVARMRAVAPILVHIVRIMDLSKVRAVEQREIQKAANSWISEVGLRESKRKPRAREHFTRVATKWLRFQNMIQTESSRIEPDQTYIEQFVDFLQTLKGQSKGTAATHENRIRAFLQWSRLNNQTLQELTLSDVETYVLSKLEAQHKPTYIVTICEALRLFFGFAYTQQWNRFKIAQNIRLPRIARCNTVPRGPNWHDVRLLLDHDFGATPAAIRAAAITALGAIYAMRRGEIVDLKLRDMDWRNEIITIRRSKNGRVQQFPLQAEVGEKIIRYLLKARPPSKSRHLFLTLSPPYRPVAADSLWVIAARRMRLLGIDSRNKGIHALRHACATRLLHEGTPLADIADFLGHRTLRSVSVYAKHDMESLRQIAAVDLQGLL